MLLLCSPNYPHLFSYKTLRGDGTVEVLIQCEFQLIFHPTHTHTHTEVSSLRCFGVAFWFTLYSLEHWPAHVALIKEMRLLFSLTCPLYQCSQKAFPTGPQSLDTLMMRFQVNWSLTTDSHTGHVFHKTMSRIAHSVCCPSDPSFSGEYWVLFFLFFVQCWGKYQVQNRQKQINNTGHCFLTLI